MSSIFAGGHRLEYRWIDPPAGARLDGLVLVFLHEGLGSMAQWKDFPELLVEETGCAAVVYSRYGYGRSDRLTEPNTVDYMHREALETLPDVLETLSIERPILVGHSDGASIALINAGARRSASHAIVAMAPHVFVEDITVESIAQAKVAFETTDLCTRLGRYHDDPVATFRGWNDVWLRPEFRAWNIERYLPAIEVPLLLIQGEDDRYGTLAQIDAVARQVRGPVRKLILSRCGHSPHLDRREATVRVIADFVNDTREGMRE